MLLGATDRAIGLIDRFAACFRDFRCPGLIEHEVETLIGQRVFGVALGYEDLIDHDQLRHDPVMAILAGKLEARREDCAPVAGKRAKPESARSRMRTFGQLPRIRATIRAISSTAPAEASMSALRSFVARRWRPQNT